VTELGDLFPQDLLREDQDGADFGNEKRKKILMKEF
jgi:hypothetical protein